jgi:histidinol-phosphate aminotransferase
MSAVLDLVREDLRGFAGYASARREAAHGSVWLNANESPTPSAADPGGTLHRYPEPQPVALRARLASLYGVRSEQVLVTRGSDEGIDLLVRAFCRAGRDAVLVTPPTFGMYAASARIQGAVLVPVPLRETRDAWELDEAAWRRAATAGAVRIAFLCSPANPTGQALSLAQVAALAQSIAGRCVLVVDEAYVEFADGASASTLLDACPGLVVLRTLSKAFALAGARIGALLGAPGLIDVLRNLAAPYPVPAPCAALALAATTDANVALARAAARRTATARDALRAELLARAGVRRVDPSQGNFLLARFVDADATRARLLARGVVVRDLRAQPGLEDALRISVGSDADNAALLAALDAP